MPTPIEPSGLERLYLRVPIVLSFSSGILAVAQNTYPLSPSAESHPPIALCVDVVLTLTDHTRIPHERYPYGRVPVCVISAVNLLAVRSFPHVLEFFLLVLKCFHAGGRREGREETDQDMNPAHCMSHSNSRVADHSSVVWGFGCITVHQCNLSLSRLLVEP